jgi:hypothetical protein
MIAIQKLKVKVKKMSNKDRIINQSQKILNANKSKRGFIANSIFDNDKKLICLECAKHSRQNYINKWSKKTICKDCLKQIELPI